MTTINLVGGAYSLDATVIDCQRCVNWYAQMAESGGGQNALIPTPAVVHKYGFGDYIAGMKTLSDGSVLVVSRVAIYRIDTQGATSNLGTISSTTFATVADNGTVAMVATGDALYAVSMANWAVTQIATNGLNKADFVAFLDGRFIVNVANSGRFAWFDLYSTNYNALSYATAEGNPDKLVCLKVVGRELWLLGEHSTEVFYSSGDKNLPFRRVGGAFLTVGCEASKTVQQLNGGLIFLGKTENGGRQVFITQGYQVQRVSTYAIEQELLRGEVSGATAYTYQQQGHGFYVLTVPNLNRTFVFDLTTGLWHERGVWDAATKALNKHPTTCHAYQSGVNWVGSVTGQVYTLDLTATQDKLTATDTGTPIYRERTLPILQSHKKRAVHVRFELEMRANNSETDETISLTWSDDYAKTWRTPLDNPLGKLTEALKRVVWRRLGMGRQRTYKINTLAKARVELVKAEIQLQGTDR